MELKTVHEVSKMTGVSIRSLHYYDQIGLFTPKEVTESGYRLYDGESLRKLQIIMLFRELEFPLKDIKVIIEQPSFDRVKALENQIGLLEMKREHLDSLIALANRLKVKGETEMSFKEFDKSKMEAYKKLAKEAYGNTDAYKEYEEKTKTYNETDHRRIAENLMDIFFEFGNLKEKDPEDAEVQAQVKKLQGFITEHYYNCTDEILESLGIMYVSGGEMTQNIDVAGGKGCAAFVAKAIDVYCGNRK